ncbi:MAG: SprB repeat-containing protein, partial [Bacteroidia bacterium]|nr:SprB repeat-containing protein [Bacteroidia bacterium]
MTVNPVLPVCVTITADATSICSGSTVTFPAAPTNQGLSPVYIWYVNGVNVGAANNSVYSTSSLSDGDVVTCQLTSSEPCATNNPALSNSETITVNSSLPVSVTISTGTTTICNGQTITFTAAPVNGGASPSYNWLINGVSAGAPDNITFTTNSISDGDIISCILTSSIGCATGNPANSNSITMTVTPLSPVSVTITESVNNICQGTSVTFTATPVNGGSTPTYDWLVNGISIGAPDNSTFTTSSLSDTDEVEVILTSSLTCVSGNPATSNAIVMNINSPLLVGVSISTVGACEGEDITFTAAPVNGGISPIYTWYVNGVNIGAPDSPVFTSSSLTNGNVVTCVLTSSETCTSNNPATSNAITVAFNPVPIVNLGTDQQLCDGGSVTLNADTGFTSYLWSDGSSNQTINVTTTGSYSITVTNSYGCQGTDMVNVTFIAAPVISIDATSDVLCNGSADGSISISVTGGIVPYNYIWTGGATTEDITGLAAGTYNVTVTDAIGCNSTTFASITEPEIIAITSLVTDESLSGNDGAIDLTVTGGVSPYSYNWSNSATIEDLTNLTAGIYTVTVTDQNGCIEISSIIVSSESCVMTAAITGTNVTCNEASTGSATVTVTDGTAPFDYQWSTGATTEDLTGLPAGIYNVTVTDVNLCMASASVTITQPAILEISYVVTDETPIGNDGAIDLTISGGTGPFTYLWSNGETTEDLANLAAGTYGITITDSNGCIANASIVVSLITCDIVATISGTNVTCNGYSDGSADLQVSGGTLPYDYLWSTGETTEDLTGISAGAYTVTVTDANSCTASTSINVSEPALLEITYTVTNESVSGNDGAIALSVTGGTPPYGYLWSNSSTDEDLFNLTAGTYNVTVSDVNGCVSTASIVVGSTTCSIFATITGTDVTCYGSTDGAADLTVTGGILPVTYQWSNGAATEDLFNLASGVYDITVTDANSCTTTATVTINQPAQLVTTIAGTNVTCNGATDGSADLTASGGTLPYTYTWSNGETTEDINNLGSGVYSVTVVDNKGCSSENSVSITQPSAIVITINAPAIACGSSNGIAVASVSGGSSPYTYLWSTGATTSFINNVPAGVYGVTVTDINGCTGTGSAIINETGAPTITVTHTDMLCAGICDGTASVSASGGTVPYSYSWSNGVTESAISGLCAGTYYVTVSGADGCDANGLAEITEPAGIIVTVSGSDVTCNGNSDGTVSANVTGGILPYTYLWSNGELTQNISGLTAGVYDVTVTDAAGCYSTGSITIIEPAAITTAFASTNISCNGANDGTVTVIVTGGTSPYAYLWSTGGTGDTESGLGAGTYSVTITDASGCTSVDATSISEPTAITITPTFISNATCGNSDGLILISASGGLSPYAYLWSTGATTSFITDIPAGLYSVTATDAIGCSANTNISVVNSNGPTITSSSTNTMCNGSCDGTASVNVSGGTPPYSYTWSDSSSTSTITDLCAGSYYVTVTDNTGCSAYNTVQVNEPAALIADISGTGITCNGFADGSAYVTVSGGISPYSYLWSNGETNNAATGLNDGVYDVTVTDANGCTAVSTISITEPAAIGLSLTGTAAICTGDNNGNITANTSGGVSPYTYLWNTGESTDALQGVSTGTYTVTITDANGCVESSSFIIIESPALSLNSIANNASCGNSDGFAAVSVISGGTTPFSYLWSTGGITNFIDGIPAGSYSVTVTDAAGCYETTTVYVSNNNGPVLSITSNNALCYGECNDSAAVSATGGTAPYSYLWSDGQTTET